MSDQKNYITPRGFKTLQTEFNELKKNVRPQLVDTIAWAAGNGDRSENGDYTYGKKKLREVDRRLRFLAKQIEAAEVIDPATVASERVKFGATVTVLNEDDEQKRYSIVGVDEIDPNMGRISWRSPLASALLNAKVGDLVTYQTPSGEYSVEILELRYLPIE